MNQKPIRILIADDHGVVRAGLQGLLNDAGFEIVAAVATGREAVTLASRLHPDVVLLDIRMPDMDGLQALAAIKAQLPTLSVIMLTTYANPEYLTRALALGAAGYLLKESDPEEIPGIVRAVAQGDKVIDQDILQAVVAAPAVPEAGIKALIEDLTEQEWRVLKLIAEGLNNDAIAELLSISRNTVKTHVRHIFEKLAVSDRTQAAIWALRHGVRTSAKE